MPICAAMGQGWGEDDDGRGQVHETAHHEQKGADKEKENILVPGDAEDPRGNRLGTWATVRT